VDLFPTIADIVGLPASSMVQPVDGVSLKPLFAAEGELRTKPLGFRYGQKTAFMQGRYKLVAEKRGQEESFQLYDLVTDPGEKKDLRGTKPEVFAEIKAAWSAWNDSVDASFAGRDYAEGKVSPADPASQSWFTSSVYADYVPQWKDYWAYQSYLKAGKGKKAE
jgi:arylsulfatase A-like enzyme